MGLAQQRYLSFIEVAAKLLLLVYPAAMLAVRGGMNGIFLLMLLLALAVWLVKPDGMSAVVWQREFAAYFASMFAMSAAILVSQTYLQHYAAHPHDAASRYWLAIPVFLLLQRLRPGVFSVLQYSFPLAAITGYLMLQPVGDRMGIATLDVIHFGDFELILGMLSLLGIDWFGRDKLPLRILKAAGFAAGMAASFASGSRGGWLAIPVFITAFIYLRSSRISLKTVAASACAALLAMTMAYFGSQTFHQRADELANDVTAFGHGNLDTSGGVRWQLYKAAAGVFAQHPVFGVGPEGFAAEMQPMLDAGRITPLAAELGRGEVHNDILSKAAGMGVFGLIAMLSIYLVPFSLFWRATKSTSEQVRRPGLLGITFVGGFFVFGLTVEFLNLTLATAFYSFTVAVLLAACYNIHHGEQTAVHQPE